MESQRRTLIAEPNPPSGVWVYEDANGDIVYDCGRCGAWWFGASDETMLADEIECAACVAAKFAARVTWTPPPDATPKPSQGACGRCGRHARFASCLLCGGA